MSKRHKTDASPASPSPVHAGPSGHPRAIDVADDALPTAGPVNPAHAVETLARAFGATPDEVALVTGGMTPEAIRAAAEESATARMADEAYRVGDVARAFFASATPAELGALRTQPVVVRVMVTSAAEAASHARQGRGSSSRRRGAASSGEVQQGQTLQRARASRDQLAEALRGVHGGDPVMLERVRDAEQPGRVGQAEAGPGHALASLAALGREALADGAQRARAAAWGVDSAWLDACERLASQAIEVTAAQNTPATPSLRASAEVHARGVAMILLRRVLGAFAAGHAAHLAVPSIEPLYLRAVFAPKRAAKKGEGDASKGDASKGEGAPAEPKG